MMLSVVFVAKLTRVVFSRSELCKLLCYMLVVLLVARLTSVAYFSSELCKLLCWMCPHLEDVWCGISS